MDARAPHPEIESIGLRAVGTAISLGLPGNANMQPGLRITSLAGKTLLWSPMELGPSPSLPLPTA